MSETLIIINPRDCNIAKLIVTITHYRFNLIVTKSDSTNKFLYKVDELRALSSYVLQASRVQIPQDDLDDLQWTRVVSTGVGLVSLGGTMGLAVSLVRGHCVPIIVKVLPVDCDPLALVEAITLLEDNKDLLVVCLVCDAAWFYVVHDDALDS
ncbi:hypothetical protein Tco_1395416 [Tanacetum coccineum]